MVALDSGANSRRATLIDRLQYVFALCDLDFWPFNPKTISLLYPKVIPYTKFEDFGIIRFGVRLRTNAQTDADDRYTHTTPVGVSKV